MQLPQEKNGEQGSSCPKSSALPSEDSEANSLSVQLSSPLQHGVTVMSNTNKPSIKEKTFMPKDSDCSETRRRPNCPLQSEKKAFKVIFATFHSLTYLFYVQAIAEKNLFLNIFT